MTPASGTGPLPGRAPAPHRVIPALARTRALLDTPPPDPIPGQLDVASAEPSTEPEHDELPLIHHQPSLWSI